MRAALIQTQQNALYNFYDEGFLLEPEQTRLLQREMQDNFWRLAESVCDKKCDLIVTTEAMNYCGKESIIGRPAGEDIPCFPEDELFGRFSDLAKRSGAWVVAGVFNKRKDASGVWRSYNSAIVYDRQGEVAAVYDKIHLAGDENDYLTPGVQTVVVPTDFGKLGVAVCYDMQFEDVCRECKEKGAEWMAVPTWGWEHGYGLKRIQETGLKLLMAMAVPYERTIEGERYPSEILDAAGNVLAAADRTRAEVLVADVE